MSNMSPVPAHYTCQGCRARGVRLWRSVVRSKAEDPSPLLCTACAEKRTCRPVPDYTRFLREGPDVWRDFMPAWPIAGTTSHWGTKTVPDEVRAWWQSLPIR
jgi:hypothetical protein